MTDHGKYQRPRLIKLANNPHFLRVIGFRPEMLRQVPIYLHSQGTFKLLSLSTGIEELANLEQQGLVEEIYIMSDDKERAVFDIQQQMVSGQLKALLRSGDVAQAKIALVSLLSEAFHDPRMTMLEGFRGVAETMVEELAEDNSLAQAFLLLAGESYSLAEYMVNVMAMLLGVTRRLRLPREAQGELALAAMLHDLGKTQLPEKLHLPAIPLSEQEYAQVRRHPQLGLELVKDRGFSQTVQQGISEHHERRDGSGYPQGLKLVSLAGQMVGLASSYEALTNPYPIRPQRLPALQALTLLKQEADAGKFAPAIFEAFAYSLTP